MTESASTAPRVVVIRGADEATTAPLLPLVEGEGEARALIWPGIGAHHRSMHRIRLGASSRTVLQQHPSEAVYHVSTGTCVVEDLTADERHDLRVGSMIHIQPGTEYRFVAGSDGAEVVGGPCPADPALYRHLESSGDESP